VISLSYSRDKREPVSFQYCEEFLPEYVLENENIWKLFLRMRIYYSLKFANRDFRTTKKKRAEDI
jgi:hypothetical protein